MVDPLVRTATSADAAVLAEMEERARAEAAGQRGGARLLEETPAVGGRWAELVASPMWWIGVGTIDDIVVGYLALALPRQPAETVAVVAQVWVDPDARGVGFGDELLSRGIHEARAASASVLEASVLPGDRDSKNLYERAGITARKITVSRLL